MAGLAIALRICQLSHLMPKSVAPIAAWAVISIGMTASALIISGYFFTRRSSPKPLPKWLRILLKSQLGMAELHQYRFGSWHVPAVSKIYVSRKAEYRDPYAPSGATSAAPDQLPVESMLKRYRHVVVVSGPGGGKSTLVAWVVGQSARWWSTARRSQGIKEAPFGAVIAITVSATQLISGSDLAEAVSSACSQAGAKIDPDCFRQRPLPGVDWLVFIDGVDELLNPVQRSTVLYTLSTYLKTGSSHMRIVVTSRPLPIGELTELRGGDVCELLLCPFDQDDVRDFSRKWFTSRADTIRSALEIEAEVDAFVASLRNAGLTAMVRLPLLATMAALIYEHKRSVALPNNRTALYAEFVSLLRSARNRDAETSKNNHDLTESPPKAASPPFSTWLLTSLDELLLTLAMAWVSDIGCSLMEVACGWVREYAPKEIVSKASESSWIGVLLNGLIATSLFTTRSSEVEFLHQSIAEYLAAGKRALNFDMKAWHAEVVDPTMRSLALFTLARSECTADAAVEMLLEYQIDDPISAGYVLADGAALELKTQYEIVIRLIGRLRDEHSTVSECIIVLGELASKPNIWAQLASTVQDSAELPWVRSLIADLLTDVDQSRGSGLLWQLVTDRRLERHPAKIWAAQRLAARGDNLTDSVNNIEPQSGYLQLAITGLSGLALRIAARDTRERPETRISAACQLADVGDRLGIDVLQELAVDKLLHPRERQLAAQALIERGNIAGTAVLRTLLTDRNLGESERRMAASVIAEQEDPAGSGILREIMADSGRDPWERRIAARSLAYRGEEIGLQVLRKIASDDQNSQEVRYEAALNLTECGDPLGAEELLNIARSGNLQFGARYSAANALLARDHESGTRILRELANERLDPWERRMAAQLLLFEGEDPIAMDVLRNLATDSSIELGERQEAARLLSAHNDPVGLELLREFAVDAANPCWERYLSAQVLAEREDAIGFDALRDIATNKAFDMDDRYMSARTLAKHRDGVGINVLEEISASQDANVEHRRQAALILTELGITGRRGNTLQG